MAATSTTAAALTPRETLSLHRQAQNAMRVYPPPVTKTAVSVVIPKEGTNQLIGTVLDDPMYLPDADVLSGAPGGWDIFMSVDPSAPKPGEHEIDVWDGSGEDTLQWIFLRSKAEYGGPSGDLFIIGDPAKPYYAGRDSATEADDDFVYVFKFDPRAADLRVHGRPADYDLVPVYTPTFLGRPGTAVFLRKPGFRDLVAVVEGITPDRLRGRMVSATRPSGTPAIPGIDQRSEPGVSNLGYVAHDDHGDTYLAGQCSALPDGYTGSGSYCVSRYDAEGERVWGRRLGTSDPGDGPWGEFIWRLEVEDGYVFVAGATQGAYGGTAPPGGLQGLSAVVAKLDAATGEQVAVRQIAPKDGHSVAWSMTKDDDGHLYVSGGTGSTSSHDVPPIIAPYVTKIRMADLGTEWFDVPRGGQGELLSTEALGGITYVPGATPGTGTVFTTGYTTGGTYLGADPRSNDVFWVRYDADGTYLNGGSFGPPTQHDGPWQSAHDSAGNLYVVGATYGAMDGEKFAGKGDGFIRKMSPTGQHLWTRLFGTPESDTIHALDIRGDEIYLAGRHAREPRGAQRRQRGRLRRQDDHRR
ncbi:hypothetical protein LRS13_13535 [Svornostia abyssi]|uniref:Uncharacterized protein n=1 Tax=Svornostia abyssi TaxID=2898438 RepID=A0ABY5PBC2_9ACTN|nr:hypothetical protein LRS13_13535 [Parviterribacteraceae bacterium J379]